jgi:hypothetical protein
MPGTSGLLTACRICPSGSFGVRPFRGDRAVAEHLIGTVLGEFDDDLPLVDRERRRALRRNCARERLAHCGIAPAAHVAHHDEDRLQPPVLKTNEIIRPEFAESDRRNVRLRQHRGGIELRQALGETPLHLGARGCGQIDLQIRHVPEFSTARGTGGREGVAHGTAVSALAHCTLLRSDWALVAVVHSRRQAGRFALVGVARRGHDSCAVAIAVTHLLSRGTLALSGLGAFFVRHRVAIPTNGPG